jgi:hypothetical protein
MMATQARRRFCFFWATSCSGVIRANYRLYGPTGPVIPAAPAGAKGNATSWCRCHFDALGPATVVLYSRNQPVADSLYVENVRLGRLVWRISCAPIHIRSWRTRPHRRPRDSRRSAGGCHWARSARCRGNATAYIGFGQAIHAGECSHSQNRLELELCVP